MVVTANSAATRALLTARLVEFELVTAKSFESVAAPAAMVELQAAEHGWDDLVWRARLIIADIAGRRGDVAEQGRVAKQANLWAAEHGDDALLARSHRLLGIFFRRLGDHAEALGHAVAGLRHADALPPRLRCSQLISLALLLDLNGRFEDANRRFAEALRIAEEHDDADQILTVLNNMAFTAYENEDAAEADRLADQMVSLAERRGIVFDGLHLDTLARIHLLSGRFAEADAVLRPVLDDPDGPLHSEGDSLPECLLTLTEIYLATGRMALAGATLDAAGALCEQRGLGAVAARVHQARSEWYAEAGRYREAYEEYRLYHARAEALHSAERETRAYAMQAVYEAAEARRSSAQFEEMANRDALTGLFNRRWVDDRLAALVTAARRAGEPLSVALVDLDHFKRINDTHSHAVGDVVLRRVGALLDGFATGSESTARLGGEEFVLLLPGVGGQAAEQRCETLAALLRQTDWTAVTGALPVTASIGVTTAPDGLGLAPALLSQADHNLYAAKRAGRDRVVGDAAVSA